MPRGASAPAGSYVALLRGINVGGKNPLPVRELAAVFREAGCADVRTYIQSGNVIRRARAELAAVARANPFLPGGGDEAGLHVLFLAAAPSAAYPLVARRIGADGAALDAQPITVSAAQGAQTAPSTAKRCISSILRCASNSRTRRRRLQNTVAQVTAPIATR
jgi:hypothetical protein